MNVRKTVLTAAAGLGVLAGSAGIASALTTGSAPASTIESEADDVQDPMLDGSIQAPDVEGQSEADEAAALEELATVTADEASAAASSANPDAVVDEVSLGNENGSVVWEVEMTDASGVELEVKVDAGNGAILVQESDDDESDDSDEADEADDADDAEDDGVDHEFEGEETGENGDGVPDADDATEAEEVAPGN